MQPKSVAQYRRQARILKALAHETRLAIVSCLERGDCCVSELAERLGIDYSAVSRHLAVLRTQGIVSGRRDGANVNYTLNAPCALRLARCMAHACLQRSASSWTAE